jgi:hypothetical protein
MCVGACIAASLLAAWYAPAAEATSVVALRVGDTILLGADSKQSLAIGTSQSVCKIAQGEGCFSPSSGRARARSPAEAHFRAGGWPGPDCGQLIRRAIAFDAQSRPREVGGPTSILEVDRAGARWVEPGLGPPIDPGALAL